MDPISAPLFMQISALILAVLLAAILFRSTSKPASAVHADRDPLQTPKRQSITPVVTPAGAEISSPSSELNDTVLSPSPAKSEIAHTSLLDASTVSPIRPSTQNMEAEMRELWWKDLEERKLRATQMRMEIEELRDTLRHLNGSVDEVSVLQRSVVLPLHDPVSVDHEAKHVPSATDALPMASSHSSSSSLPSSHSSSLATAPTAMTSASSSSSPTSTSRVAESASPLKMSLRSVLLAAAKASKEAEQNGDTTMKPSLQIDTSASPSGQSAPSSPLSDVEGSSPKPKSRGRSIWDRLHSTLHVMAALKSASKSAAGKAAVNGEPGSPTANLLSPAALSAHSGADNAVPASPRSVSSGTSRRSLSAEARVRNDIDRYRARRMSKSPSVSSGGVEFDRRKPQDEDISPRKARFAVEQKLAGANLEWTMSLRSSSPAANKDVDEKKAAKSDTVVVKTAEEIEADAVRRRRQMQWIEQRTMEKIRHKKQHDTKFVFEGSLRDASVPHADDPLHGRSQVVDPERASKQAEHGDRLTRLPKHRTPRRYVSVVTGEVLVPLSLNDTSQIEAAESRHVLDMQMHQPTGSQLLIKPGLHTPFGPDAFATTARLPVLVEQPDGLGRSFAQPRKAVEERSVRRGDNNGRPSDKVDDWRSRSQPRSYIQSPSVNHALHVIHRVRNERVADGAQSTTPKHPPPSAQSSTPKHAPPSAAGDVRHVSPGPLASR